MSAIEESGKLGASLGGEILIDHDGLPGFFALSSTLKWLSKYPLNVWIT